MTTVTQTFDWEEININRNKNSLDEYTIIKETMSSLSEDNSKYIYDTTENQDNLIE